MMTGRCRLLLVEDNPGDAGLIRLALESSLSQEVDIRCELTWKSRLADAVGVIQAGDVDVVLLDLTLPDAHGLTGLASIREASDSLPVLVLTGRDDGALALEALRSGAQDYLVKGTLDGAALRRALRYAIERKEVEKQLSRARWLSGIGEIAIAIRHEINNPLTSLLANAELVDGDSTPDELRFALGEMTKAARRIGAIVRKLDRLEEPRSVEYIRDVRMIDLSDGA